ncbi:hypothetical protein AB4Z23_29100, partial [Agrobacterium sp. MCAB5]
RPALGKGGGTPESAEKLDARLAGLRLKNFADMAFSAEKVPCGTWMVEPNDQAIESIAFAANNNELSVTLRDADGEHQVRAHGWSNPPIKLSKASLLPPTITN